MKNKKANVYVIISVVVIFILILGGFFLFYTLKKSHENSKENQNPEIQEKVIMNCEVNEDCKDGNPCIINSCSEKKCVKSEVLLCYNNDGCCPENCNSGNDNDCLGVE